MDARKRLIFLAVIMYWILLNLEFELSLTKFSCFLYIFVIQILYIYYIYTTLFELHV